MRLLLGATGRGVSDERLREAARGRVILVTGASSGVGRATARRLGRAGATVLLLARRVELLEVLREEIEDGGGRAFVHPCDMADTDQVAKVAGEVLERHGRVDVVVANAGVSIRRWISESRERFHDVERTISVNYLGPVRLLLGLLPSMRERGSGHIVNVATMGVDFPALRWSAYIASKAAFETWLGGAAPEILADGVTTTSIHLQLVRSPMLGPFRMWSYLPGMSTEEAAGIVCRAIVERPRVISPVWARVGGSLHRLFQAPVEQALSRYARRTNPDCRGRIGGDERRPAERREGVISQAAGAITTVAASGVVRPVRPDRLVRAGRAWAQFGTGAGGALAAAAALHGDRPAVIDELGEITFAQLDADAASLAAALHQHFDLRAGRRVALMCRNHRGFIRAQAAIARLGCDLVPLNSDFAGPQLADVLRREGVTAAVHDQEFEPVFDAAAFDGTRVIGWHERPEPSRPTLEALISIGADTARPPAARGRTIMLTSGTTGTPKGAIRTVKAHALAPLALSGFLELSRFKPTPRSGAPLVVCPPLFHLYGQIGLFAGLGLGSAIVLRRRFDAEATLAQIDRTRAQVLLAVPTMLKRIIDLPVDTRTRHDTSSLRMIVSGAAPLAGELATAVMDAFGEILYNGYASTEVGPVTLAAPKDLRAAPGTVGRPAPGVKIKILDEEGLELATGATAGSSSRTPCCSRATPAAVQRR